MEKVSDSAPSTPLRTKLYGFAYGAPFAHFFHKLMDTIFKGKKDTKTTVAKKVLLEQLMSSPWNNSLSLCTMAWWLKEDHLALSRVKFERTTRPSN